MLSFCTIGFEFSRYMSSLYSSLTLKNKVDFTASVKLAERRLYSTFTLIGKANVNLYFTLALRILWKSHYSSFTSKCKNYVKLALHNANVA